MEVAAEGEMPGGILFQSSARGRKFWSGMCSGEGGSRLGKGGSRVPRARVQRKAPNAETVSCWSLQWRQTGIRGKEAHSRGGQLYAYIASESLPIEKE